MELFDYLNIRILKIIQEYLNIRKYSNIRKYLEIFEYSKIFEYIRILTTNIFKYWNTEKFTELSALILVNFDCFVLANFLQEKAKDYICCFWQKGNGIIHFDTP